MVKDFIFTYAKTIAANPERLEIFVEEKQDNLVDIVIMATKVDAGRLIGKSGKIITAIKTIAVNNKNTQKLNYKITVKTFDE
ncbi:KH domain-containing protein [Campylobacter sp. Cr9]|uniref:KH domain-containing protein n=1 Tax=unclassified Campylobacter TaxID=2593542 RepID=UPI001EFBFECC|nr:KH domain-containing protein [Campylobacter sp. RM5004]MBZ7986447.1 KH domain-containing protein [Campylobacter sp. Cr9]ULO02312.1 putative RNA-binding protein (KH domain) [Campylobacter sp. RM5004]